MTLVRANGIDIDYAERGTGPALVLLRGLGTQRIEWPESLLQGLAACGLRVITLDNRDAGLSQKFHGEANIAAALAARSRGEVPASPYRLADMAEDVVGLLDALAIERAHVAGISMGGMIAQQLALRWGQRLHSLTSIMSSSGASDLPGATPEALEALRSSPATPDRDAVAAHAVWTTRVFGSPGYPIPDTSVREIAERCYDRSYCPAGVARQTLAALAEIGRAEKLSSIRTPTLVIHGEQDPLVPIECGRDTASRIPGATFQAIPGMGHDIAPQLAPRLVELIVDHVKRSGSG